jgi:hypothetical protein
MSSIQKFYTSRQNNTISSDYVGENGRLWYNPDDNTIRVYNGTPGGQIVSSGVTNPFDQNLNTYNDVTFGNVTVNGNLISNYNPFNQTLNTTDSPTFANLTITGTLFANTAANIDLGNIYIQDETIYGRNLGEDITIYPAGAFQGNVRFNGNVVPDVPFYTLGTPDNPWEQAYVGPHSLTILPESGGTNVILENSDNILKVSGAGFAVYDPTGTYFSFQIEPDGHGIHQWINPTIGQSVLRVTGNPSANVIPLVSTATGGLLHLTGAVSGPSLLTIDNFDNLNPTASGSAIVLRRFRGTVDSPGNIAQYDRLGSLSAAGYGAGTPYTANGLPAGAQNSIVFRATEDHTLTAQGADIEIWAVPNGTIQQQQILTFNPSGSQPGLVLNQTNSGITFTDGSFQTTAFNAANGVTSVTTGTGFASPGTYTGAVSLNSTDVENVASSSYSLQVTDLGSKNLTLHLSQEIAPNSSPVFANLTVSNLTVNGTFTTAINNTVNGKILYLANNSTASSQIDGGGIILGNVQQSYYKSILYSLANDWWDTDGAGINTQNLNSFSANVTGNLNVTQGLNVGTAYSGVDYSNAGIQNIYNTNSFSQIVNQNLSPGTQASTDFVATADTGNDSMLYIDLGINSSGFNAANLAYNTLGLSSGPLDGYLLVQGNTDSTKPGGNLTIGTLTPGRVITFNVTSPSGTYANTVGTAASTGWTFGNIGTGSIYTNNYFYANGVSIFTGINSGITNLQNEITAANAAIVTANSAVVSYVNSQISTVNTSITNVTTAWQANAAFQNTWLSNLQANIGSVNANIGSYYTWANLNYATQSNVGSIYTHINTLDANVGLYEINTNANIGSIFNHLNTLDANVGAYESWANANVAGLYNSITGANVAWQANAAFQNTWLSNLQANITTVNANVTAANATIASIHSFSNIQADGSGWANASTSNSTLTLVAGNNMSISSNAQTNTITITNNSLFSTSGFGNTYINCYDTTTQTPNSNVRIANPITINTTAFSANITNNNGNIIMASPGIYNLAFSIQFNTTDNSSSDAYVWLRQNGVDVANTSSDVSVQRPNGGGTGKAILALNYFVKTTTPNEYCQLYWWTNDASYVTLQTIGAQSASSSNPSIPASPAVILTMNMVKAGT